ncbi:hypothetical protein GNY17_23745 [Vibrio parahaemolyticus]|nr:hypothetical protein [Vibrio parahaemolyticus]QGT93859.1 hypothetical protein GNY17_23745 [Vibrio parahaemolyticus]HAS6427040.1 hypothetical protein [Vibrio parahaemolyticus]
MDFKTLASSGAVFVNQVMRPQRNISRPSGFSVI